MSQLQGQDWKNCHDKLYKTEIYKDGKWWLICQIVHILGEKFQLSLKNTVII